MSKDRNVYETNVVCVGHSRKSWNVGIHFFLIIYKVVRQWIQN